jgi:hypothetical protein
MFKPFRKQNYSQLKRKTLDGIKEHDDKLRANWVVLSCKFDRIHQKKVKNGQ